MLPVKHKHPRSCCFAGRCVTQVVGLLSSKGSRASSADVDCHLQAASRAFFANREIILDRNVCLEQRFEFFDAVVTPVACFAAGHAAILHADIRSSGCCYGEL